jgi:hypothetical protein
MIEANFLIPQNADMCVREREEIGKKDDTHKQMFAFIVFVGRRLFTLSKNEKMPNYFLKGIQLKSMFFERRGCCIVTMAKHCLRQISHNLISSLIEATVLCPMT